MISIRRRGGPGPQPGRGARHWNSRQRTKFIKLEHQTAQIRQHFRKFRVFKISVSWTTVAWQRITFSFGNAWPSYFQKIKFKHIAAAWFQNFSGFHSLRPRKSGQKSKIHTLDKRKTLNNRPRWCNYSSVQPLCESRKAGGKPSTWLPPGGFAERFRK